MPTQITYKNPDETSQLEVNDLRPFPVKIAGGLVDDLAQIVRVEQQFKPAYCAGVDTLVKSGPGFLHTLTFTQIDPAPTAGTIIVYDNTAESGTIIFSSTWTTAVFYPTTVTLDVQFLNGLYVGYTTLADIGVTVSYR